MAEFSYIEHLNIEAKRKGSILHSYEYNATVNKINEIVDNMRISYEIHQTLPDFTLTDDPITSTSYGTGVIINNQTDGKLYPVTGSSYVVTGPGKTLDTTLDELSSAISNIDLNYKAGDAISISDDRKISVRFDGRTLRINEEGKLEVNGEEILSGVESKLKFIGENGEWLGGLDIKNYIDENDDILHNEITTAYNTLNERMNDMETYVNDTKSEIYSYIKDFAEYDIYNKDYSLSTEFLEKQ